MTDSTPQLTTSRSGRRRPFGDIDLARRLESTDALAGVEFARSWARLNSFTGEVFLPVAGGLAAFAGVDSPVTQAFGLGLNGPVTESDMEAMEEFYGTHESPINVETCPRRSFFVKDVQ